MKRSISIGLFLVMVFVVWWSITTDYSAQHVPAREDPHYIELFMNDFEVISMNESGKPAYRLQGEYLQRYHDADDTEIRQPVFYLLDADRRWKVSADYAVINRRADIIDLNENVIMQQQDSTPPLNIRTRKLRIHIRQQRAQTDELVHIQYGDSRLRSQGMVFDNLSSELQLNAQVSGYYLPYED